jgi:uncharacterized protein YciI/ketosteroid isomerase-like protein
MKYVLLYESADNVLAKGPAHFDAHVARGHEFHDRGSLQLYGPFGDPQLEGSMAVFSSREAAEEFAKGDPFVLNGVVRDWQIREWDETFAGDEALSVVRAYHDAWTSKRFDQAAALLADELEVEVPINEYPTTESFAKALEAFGSMVERVHLLSRMSAGDEVMLLYDIDVQGLGTMRIAEHFTVKDGKIARIRQIHDTAALRAAGFVESETTTS